MANKRKVNFSARDPLPGVSEWFFHRWSPRAFAPDPIPQEELEIIFDAARWSPSCYNDQPWQFLTSTEGSHKDFVKLLAEGNQVWARAAPVLGFILANRYFGYSGDENRWAKFDAGSAWMAMTLQARLLGLYTHGMAGIDYDGVYETFGIDREKTEVICGFALGKIGDPESLPDRYRKKESPTPRKDLEKIWLQCRPL